MLLESRGNENYLSRLVLISGFRACFIFRGSNERSPRPRRTNNAHDVRKTLLQKRYARVSFSPAKSEIYRAVDTASSCPTRVGLVEPPRARRHNSEAQGGVYYVSPPQLAATLVLIHPDSKSLLEFFLQDVKILAAFRLAVARPDLVQQIAHLQAGAGPTAAVLFRRVVLRARAQRGLAAILPRPFPKHLPGPLGVL